MSSAAMKSCPYCAEDIRVEAIRCPHCRSDLAGLEVAGDPASAPRPTYAAPQPTPPRGAVAFAPSPYPEPATRAPMPQLPPAGRVRQSDEKYCGTCGMLVHVSAPTCPGCGAAFQQIASVPQPALAAAMPADMKYCSGCAKPVHKTAASCPYCGARLLAPSSSPLAGPSGARSRTLAIVLAVFLGGLGAHKFYLGQMMWGVIYLVFCWTFIPAIVGLVEGILYAGMSDEKFAEQYG